MTRATCGGLMYKPWDDHEGLRCFQCKPASFRSPTCQWCGGRMYVEALDGLEKCWNCARTPITRQATAEDHAELRYNTMRGGVARELRRLNDSAS